MNTILQVLKAILAVIGISVLLFNPSFLVAATKGGHAHQPKMVVRKAPAPLPQPDRATHQKPVKRPKPKIKLQGKNRSANIDKRRTTVKPPVNQKDKRLVNRQQRPKPDSRQMKTDKPPVNQKDKRLVNRQQRSKPDPRQMKTDKPPVNQKDKRLANKQLNLANEKSRKTHNRHSPRTVSDTAPRNISTDSKSVHNQRTISNQEVTDSRSNSRHKSVGLRTATRQLRDMPKRVDVPITIGGASQTAKLNSRNNKLGNLFGKPAIVVPQTNSAQVVGETSNRNIDRTSIKKPAASIGPRLNAEAASQTNPIHQQNWTSNENIKSQQEALVQAASISDKAKRESNAALSEVPGDESDLRGKLELDRIDLQGTTRDIEEDQGIVVHDDTGDHLDRDRSTDTVQGWKDKLSLPQVGTGLFSDVTELILVGHGEGLGGARSPGNVADNSSESEKAHDNLIHQVGGKTLKDSTAEHQPAGNPSSGDPGYSGGWLEDWGRGQVENGNMTTGEVAVAIDRTARGVWAGGGAGGTVAGFIGAIVSGATTTTLAVPIIAGIAIGVAYQVGQTYAEIDDVNWQVGDTHPEDKMPNPDDDSEAPERDDPQAAEAARAAVKARQSWVAQTAGDEANEYGEIDQNAPKDRAKQRRDWAINWGNGENETGGGGGGLQPHEKLGPDPVEIPSLESEAGIGNQ